MASPLVIERTGGWGATALGALLLVAAAPAIPLSVNAAASLSEAGAFAGSAFAPALGNSTAVAAVVTAAAFGIGLPAGVVLALYSFPFRRAFLALLALPLLVPSFLWAIGWTALAARTGSSASAVSGFSGCVLVSCGPAVSLALLASYAATGTLSASQVDSARIAGGEMTVIRKASRHAAIPVLLAAALAGVLTLQDPGPGQILGLKTAASEILTGFSALFDFALAGRQCALLTAVVLAAAVPLTFFAAPRIASQVLSRQARGPGRARHPGVAAAAVAAFSLISATWLVLPLLGLVLPLFRQTQLLRAWSVVARTASDTILYSLGAGCVAATMAFLLAFLVGRSRRRCVMTIAVLLVLLSLPPAFGALGIVQTGSRAPAWSDPLLRSRLTVCLALGLRFLPVAAVLVLRAWGSTSTSWTQAAAIHGVPLGKYLRKVFLPVVAPALAVTVLLVSLLAAADVGTVLLLHPPGHGSLPLAIFTVMANAPQSLVASLCLLYVLLACGVLLAAWTFARWRTA